MRLNEITLTCCVEHAPESSQIQHVNILSVLSAFRASSNVCVLFRTAWRQMVSGHYRGNPNSKMEK